MTKAEQEWSLIEALVYCKGKRLTKKSCAGCPYAGAGCAIDATIAKLKAQEPRVMTLDLPPEEWQDKVIWLEIKEKKPIPCLFRKCCDRMMFGRYERIMSFDAIGSSKEGGYFLRNYGVNWRCWTSRPTDTQREATPWEHEK